MTQSNTTISALEPRVQITRPSECPTGEGFAYFVRFFKPQGAPRGVLLLWTDSLAYAQQFAKDHHVYARPSKVEPREAWDTARSIGISEQFR